MSGGLGPMRRKIDEIDSKIVKLMIERNDAAKQVGELKKELGISLRNHEVEESIARKYRQAAEGTTLPSDAAERVCRLLISISVDLQSVILRNECAKKVVIIGGEGKMGKWMHGYFETLGSSISTIDISVGDTNDLKDADIVVISVPISAVGSVLKDVDDKCRSDALIFDISSVKSPFADVLKDMAKRRKVCSVHPMFGPSVVAVTERNIVICDCGNADAVTEVKELFDNGGPNIIITSVERHDEFMAYVLALAHAANITLFNTLRTSGIPFSELNNIRSATFEKTMDASLSVSKENGKLYHEIQHLNINTKGMWEVYEKAFNEVKEACLSDDPKKFIEIMELGRIYLEGI